MMVSEQPMQVASPGSYPTRRELRRMREEAERAEAERLASAPTPDAQAVEPAAPVEPPVAPEQIVPVIAAVSETQVPATAVSESPEIPEIPIAPAAVRAQVVAEPADLAPRRSSRRAVRPRPAAGPRAPRSLRQRITATATMVLVGGIFASLTLPAYAFSEQQDTSVVAQDTSSQNFADKSEIAPVVARDSYTATSSADLKALYATAIKQKNLQAYLNSTARALGDDYPWYDQLDREQGGGLSPLRYYYRECVDFVAWRLNRDAGYTSAPFKWDWSTLTPGNGNASGWKSAWLAHGWQTSSTPIAGSVAWWGSGNHVAYVNSVLPGGQVLLEEYNYGTDHQYDQRIVAASSVDLFLYPPPE